MPEPDYRAALYRNYVSLTHRRDIPKGDASAYRDRFHSHDHRVKRFLPESKEAAILDLACGAGEFLYYLKSLGYSRALGIDISDEQLGEARGVGLENVRQEDLFEHLRRHPGEYDFILASHVVEHLPKADLLEALRLAGEALRAGGKVLVLCPNAGSPLGIQAAFGDLTHETYLTGLSLAQAARSAGLEIVHLGGVGPDPVGVRGRLKAFTWSAVLRPLLVGLCANRRVRFADIVEPELIGVFGR